MFDQFFSIPKQMQPELEFDDFSFAPTFSPAAESAAERFVRQRVEGGAPILFVHPETLTDKMWSPASLSWVLEQFLEARSDYTVFLSTVLRHPLQVRSHHQHRVVWVDEHLELALAILKHADLFLGVDSCFLHAADLYRIAGIGLFGPTNPYRFGFRLSPRVLTFWGKGRMEAIRPKAVLDALLEMAEGVRPRADMQSTRPVPSVIESSREEFH